VERGLSVVTGIVLLVLGGGVAIGGRHQTPIQGLLRALTAGRPSLLLLLLGIAEGDAQVMQSLRHLDDGRFRPANGLPSALSVTTRAIPCPWERRADAAHDNA